MKTSCSPFYPPRATGRKHRLTKLQSAPAAIRLLRCLGAQHAPTLASNSTPNAPQFTALPHSSPPALAFFGRHTSGTTSRDQWCWLPDVDKTASSIFTSGRRLYMLTDWCVHVCVFVVDFYVASSSPLVPRFRFPPTGYTYVYSHQ